MGGTGELKWVGAKKYKEKDTLLINFNASGFNFKDNEDIYLDPKTFKPFFVEREGNIFGRKEQISEDYTTAGQIKITKKVDGKSEQNVLKVDGEVDNIYGFIYRYRKEGSFKVGDTIQVNLPTKKFKIKMIKETKLSMYAKTYDTYYMQSDPPQYRIWFDASDKKIPLRIIGGGQMNMSGYEE